MSPPEAVQRPAATSASSAACSASSSSSSTSFTGHVVNMPADGNCLFHAMFHELRRLGLGTEVCDAHALRLHLADWIQQHGDKAECAGLSLAEWIQLETDDELAGYVARMRRDGEWGGITEMYALTVGRRPTPSTHAPSYATRHPRSA